MLNYYTRCAYCMLLLLFCFQINTSLASNSNSFIFSGDTIILDDSDLSTALCEGLLVDDGGIMNNYSDNQNNSINIESPGAVAYQLNFLTLQTEMCCDNLTVQGFTNGVETFFETFRGNQNGEERTINAEYLVIKFSADGSSTDAGFAIEFNCILPSEPTANFVALNSNPCNPEVVLLDQSLGFPNAWTWYLNDVSVSNQQNPTIALPSEGNYSIKLIACNALGCDTLEKIDYINYTAGQLFCDTTFLFDNLNTLSVECTGVLVDDGGINGDYSNFGFANLIVDVPGAIGYRINVKSFNTQDCCAQLYVLKDDGYGQEFIRSFEGNPTTPISFDVYSDAVIFNWNSNGGDGAEGFDITWECLVPSEPIADFYASNTEICNGLISLFDQSSGVPESWEWLVDDVLMSNDQNPEILLANEGIYDIELRVCNSFGCDTIVKEDYINYEQIGFCDTLILDGFEQITSCQGVIFDNGGPDGDFTPWQSGEIELNFPGGDGVRITVKDFNVGNEGSMFIEDIDNGQFLYNLTGSVDSFTFEVATSRIYMAFYPGFETASGFEITYECIESSLPNAFFDISNQAQCSPNLEFSNLTSGLATEWTWKVNGNVFSDQFLLFYEMEPGIANTISLTACNDVGCDSYTYPETLIFDPGSIDCSEIIFSENNFQQFSTNCEGTLYDSGGPNGNYTSNSFPTLRVRNPGIEGYQIHVEELDLGFGDYLEVYQADGYNFTLVQIIDEATTEFNFYTYGPDVIINFIGQGGETAEGFKINWSCKTDDIPPFLQVFFFDDFCSNEFFFESTSYAANEIIWDMGDGTILTGDFVNHTYANNGTYNVTAMAINDVDTAFYMQEVMAEFKEVAFDAPTEIFVNLAFTAELTSHDPYEFTQNFWYLNNEFIGDGASITFNLSNVGNNVLRCEMLDNYGCESTFTQVIEGLINTGNVEQSNLPFSLFPNPTPGKLRIEGLAISAGEKTILIHDALGQRFYHEQHQGNDSFMDIDAKALNPGVYFITVKSGELQGVQRFVKI